MEFFGIAITLFSIVLTYLVWSNGKWMKTTVSAIQNSIASNHADTKEWFKKMDDKDEQRHIEGLEWFRKTDERDEQRHRELTDLFKRGFGDLSRDVRNLKSNPSVGK